MEKCAGGRRRGDRHRDRQRSRTKRLNKNSMSVRKRFHSPYKITKTVEKGRKSREREQDTGGQHQSVVWI